MSEDSLFTLAIMILVAAVIVVGKSRKDRSIKEISSADLVRALERKEKEKTLQSPKNRG